MSTMPAMVRYVARAPSYTWRTEHSRRRAPTVPMTLTVTATGRHASSVLPVGDVLEVVVAVKVHQPPYVQRSPYEQRGNHPPIRGPSSARLQNGSNVSNPAAYSLTRWNALRFGIHHDGPIPCLGIDRCKLRHCTGTSYIPPGNAEPCPWEMDYHRALIRSFVRRYTPPEGFLRADVHTVAPQAANLALRRLRASIRSNRAWVFDADGSLPSTFYHEDQLSHRYYNTITNEALTLTRGVEEATSAQDPADSRGGHHR